MAKPLELADIRRGCLTAIRPVGNTRNGQLIWLVRCECGDERRMTGWRFNLRDHRCRHLIAGKSRTPEYRSWERMMARCLNAQHQRYKDYGGRGIEVCQRWQSFLNFLNDMGLKPSPEHSLDRIDVHGNYEPGNCRWATDEQQRRNTQRTVYVPLTGERLIELCEVLGLDRNVVYGRLKIGWPLEEAIRRPVRPKRPNRPKPSLDPGP